MCTLQKLFSVLRCNKFYVIINKIPHSIINGTFREPGASRVGENNKYQGNHNYNDRFYVKDHIVSFFRHSAKFIFC